jgi:hypothetical protein
MGNFEYFLFIRNGHERLPVRAECDNGCVIRAMVPHKDSGTLIEKLTCLVSLAAAKASGDGCTQISKDEFWSICEQEWGVEKPKEPPKKDTTVQQPSVSGTVLQPA